MCPASRQTPQSLGLFGLGSPQSDDDLVALEGAVAVTLEGAVAVTLEGAVVVALEGAELEWKWNQLIKRENRRETKKW